MKGKKLGSRSDCQPSDGLSRYVNGSGARSAGEIHGCHTATGSAGFFFQTVQRRLELPDLTLGRSGSLCAVAAWEPRFPSNTLLAFSSNASFQWLTWTGRTPYSWPISFHAFVSRTASKATLALKFQQFSFWRFHPFWTTGVPVQEGARVLVARARPDPARSFGA